MSGRRFALPLLAGALLAFLGYGTHGDFLIMDAPQVESGYEFPPRPLP